MIINIVIRYQSIQNFIISDKFALFISKFWFFIYYFEVQNTNFILLFIFKLIAKLRDKRVG